MLHINNKIMHLENPKLKNIMNGESSINGQVKEYFLTSYSTNIWL